MNYLTEEDKDKIEKNLLEYLESAISIVDHESMDEEAYAIHVAIALLEHHNEVNNIETYNNN